jgi:hypothetical protein
MNQTSQVFFKMAIKIGFAVMASFVSILPVFLISQKIREDLTGQF